VASPALRADDATCSLGHNPKRIRIFLNGDCEQPELIKLRMDGDSRAELSAGLNKAKGYWEGDGFDAMIKSVHLCTALCLKNRRASSCIAGEPKTDTDESGKKICVAVYRLPCDEPGWSLALSSVPLVTLSYTRRRPEPQSVEQRGQLKAAPGSRICDLAVDEEVKLKPQFKSKGYIYTDIPVSHALLKDKHDSWPMGFSDLKEYLVRPDGRRAQSNAVTPAEEAFIKRDLEQLILQIEKIEK
jgi:hypothetical protein